MLNYFIDFIIKTSVRFSFYLFIKHKINFIEKKEAFFYVICIDKVEFSFPRGVKILNRDKKYTVRKFLENP